MGSNLLITTMIDLVLGTCPKLVQWDTFTSYSAALNNFADSSFSTYENIDP